MDKLIASRPLKTDLMLITFSLCMPMVFFLVQCVDLKNKYNLEVWFGAGDHPGAHICTCAHCTYKMRVLCTCTCRLAAEI